MDRDRGDGGGSGRSHEPENDVLRVLIVDEALAFGGSIVSTANLIRGLDHDRVLPVFVSAADPEMVADKLQEAEGTTPVRIVRKLFHYNRLQGLTTRIGSLPLRPLSKLLIYLLYGVRLLGNIPFTWRILRLLVRDRIDLVQLNNGMGADEVHLLCLLLGKPRVVFLRGYTPMSRIERALFLPGVRHFVSVSQYIKERAVEDGVDPGRITVATPPAIVEHVTDDEIAAVRARHGLSRSDRVFGIVGRVVDWKGQAEFLRAARLVLAECAGSRALVIGGISDGGEGYLRELEDFVRAEGLEDRVSFTGYRSDVDAYYRVLDVVVHCSIGPEPSGRVIFEAMSYGVPVVASDRGGPREFVEQDVDGYIVDPTDPEAVADRVIKLLTDDDLRDAFGERARRKMARSYNKEVYARTVEAVYREAMGRGGRSDRMA